MKQELPDDAFFDFLKQAVREALAHEDADRFLAWSRAHATDYLERAGAETPAEPDERELLGLHMGRALWNALPLPGNGFAPRRLPTPGRNEPCFCGSGRKYKHCCLHVPPMPEFDPQEMLNVMVSQLDAATLERLRAEGNLPLQGMMTLAETEIENGRPRKAAKLLEPLFAGTPARHDALADHAMNLLCDCYDQLDWWRKKETLLQGVVKSAPQSPLRSGAWQRLATMRMDTGNREAAWQAFRNAQRDEPDAPHVGLLEVQLHLACGEAEQARRRASFWVKRLERMGVDPQDQGMQFFSRVAKDPAGALSTLGFETMGEGGALLRDWLEAVAGRALPAGYRPGDPASEPQNGGGASELRRMLAAQGVPRESIAGLVEKLENEAPPEDAGETGEPPPGAFLECPPELERLYSDWRLVFPLDKPFSVQNLPFDLEDDPWLPENEQRWTAFLHNHPEAFDSLDILDDLATALFAHSQVGGGWLEETLLLPVLHRAQAIVEAALRQHPHSVLPWGYADNRPALRSLARLILVHFNTAHDELAMPLIEQLLRINPDDNHGFRTLLANYRLQQGEDENLLALADHYPDDMNPELAYGRVLAFYRLKRTGEAREALREAVGGLPEVPHYLTASRVRKPAVDPHSVRMGGKDQAWLYREDMRATWQATPGALEWLRESAKKIARE